MTTPPGRAALRVGTRLGPYEIVATLGAGGMGDVYRARDTRLGRDIALKTLPPEFASDPERLHRFDLEARAVGALSDPHVVTIYDVGVHEGIPFVVFELVEGDTLRKRLERGALPVGTALNVATQVALGLAAAHDRGIVHRDLKPENIVIARDGRVKILDFGLAKRVTAGHAESPAGTATMEASPTNAGSVYGTVGYMAPEQIRGQHVDGRTDLFALGAILYEMLAGRRAFAGATPADVQSAILSVDPEPLPGDVQRVAPRGLERVLGRALEKEPAARPQNARDLAFDLEILVSLEPSAKTPSRPAFATPRAILWSGALLILLGGVLFVGFFARKAPDPRQVTYQRLTFRNGSVHDARFAPDGRAVLYTASWDGESVGVYMAQPGSPETKSLGYTNTALFAVSRDGDLGLGIRTTTRPHLHRRGTLARVPLAGGAPREIVDSVEAADWGPDGTLAVVIPSAGRYRLECPPGHVLRDTPGWLTRPRLSPKGDWIAFFEHDVFPDDRGSLLVMDRQGRSKVLASGFASCQGLAWRPDGREVWFSATRTGTGAEIYAATLSGRIRTVARGAGGMRITDIAPDGRVLFIRDSNRTEMHARSRGNALERDLTWGDWSVLADVSADGKRVLFGEEGDAVRGQYAVCVRGTDGSAVVRLGEGSPFRLSPDGRYALAATLTSPSDLLLLPTGPGEPRRLPRGPIRSHFVAAWFPDGQRILSIGADSAGRVAGYVQDTAGGVPRLVLNSIETAAGGMRLTPDGKYFATSPVRALYSITGGATIGVPGIGPGERLFCGGFSDSGREMFVVPMGQQRTTVFAIDLSTGRRRPIDSITPLNPAGVTGIPYALVTDDELVYVLNRNLSEIYVAQGLR